MATRTWVSGVGDDANPCSRTAPCKTFAGAISKTAAGGGIVVAPATGSARLTATINNCWIQGNGNAGLVLLQGSIATIADSFITANAFHGVYLEQGAGSTECNVENCVIAHNGSGVTVLN